ncbi:MAG: hypothetical protein QM504_15815 [Pseudomonadota bacterium]
MKENRFSIFILSYFLLFFSLPVNATEYLASYADYSLEELMNVKVFIASGEEQLISKSPSVVIVITSKDIKNTGIGNSEPDTESSISK